MAPHLQRCQGLAVADYSFTLGRLEAGAPSTFAHLGYYFSVRIAFLIIKPRRNSDEKVADSIEIDC
jgi:hypothetical protein